MHVLMTTDTVGGVWTFTQELSAGLLQEGCSVTLVSLGCAPTEAQSVWAHTLENCCGAFDFQSCSAPLEWMQDNQHALTAAAPLLLRLVCDREADVLHSNQFCFGALQASIPKVITAHSDVLSWSEACRGESLPDSPWIEQYRALVSEGLRSADSVVAPTRWMLHALKRHFPPPHESCVIPNGRDIHSAEAWSSRSLQAITAGRLWDEAKGIALLRDVSSPMPIFIAGHTSCEAAQLPDALGEVQLLGPLTEASLLQYFQQSAIYICTSRYEPFGLAPLEAALCGCAVLANDLPSLREVWEDGALYFRDATGLSELLHALHRDQHLLRSAQVRSLARGRIFSRSAMVSSYLHLYRSLAKSKDRPNVA